MSFKNGFIVAHRFKGGGTGADDSHSHAGKGFYNTAGSGKLLEFRNKLIGIGRYGEGGIVGIFYSHLCENACESEFSAEGVAAMLEIHFPELVRISLNENGDVNAAQCSLNSVFISEVGQAYYKTVIFSAMFGKKLVIEISVGGRFDRIVFGFSLFKGEAFHLCLCKCRFHFGIRGIDDAAWEKASVCY